MSSNLPMPPNEESQPDEFFSSTAFQEFLEALAIIEKEAKASLPAVPEDKETEEKRLEEGEEENKRLRRLEGDDFEHDIKFRRNFAIALFFLLLCWLSSVGFIVLLQGFGSDLFGKATFHLEEKILLTILITTNGSVFGLLFLVVRYFFRPKK